MSLIVTLLVVTSVGQCWSAPQRRNWTPQAILYLTGAQGHRSVAQRTSKEDGGPLQPVTHDQSSDGLDCLRHLFFWSSCSQLWRKVEAIQIVTHTNES